MKINFEKGGGLVPAIVQDARTLQVLMLGYMNAEALEVTRSTGKVTFFSRSKQRLWTKGEESGHTLAFQSVQIDCDQDTLLVKAVPAGPVCHTGEATCFGPREARGFLQELQSTIESRKGSDPETSYTSRLFDKGTNKIAQKVGEEAVELVIEAKDDNDELFMNEAADLLYHLLVLLSHRGTSLEAVEAVLLERNAKN